MSFYLNILHFHFSNFHYLLQLIRTIFISILVILVLPVKLNENEKLCLET